MNVEVETLPNCLATLKVELPPDRVSKTWNEIARDYTRLAKIPGFRAGKAPMKVIENKFKKEIKDEVTKRLLSEGCRQAIAEKQLRVISLSGIDDVEIADDKSMRFTATLITSPDFELPTYIGIPVPEKTADVTEAEVDASLESVRNQSADFIDVPERGLQMEDFAVIDYTGTIDGKPVHEVYPKAGHPLSSKTDFWIRMTPEAFFPGFAQALLGARPGDARAFDIQVPSDFTLTEMANQTIHYEVTVKGVKEKKLPEMNDQWAAGVAPGKTLAELRELARAELSQQKEFENSRERKDHIMRHLLAKVECELPESLVRDETRRLLANVVRENQARGVADEMIRENERDLVDSAARGAREKLKGTFILLRIADQEKISVSEAELQNRIRSLAQRYQMAPEKMRKELEKRDALGEVREEVLAAKVLDFLSSNVTFQTNPAPAASV